MIWSRTSRSSRPGPPCGARTPADEALEEIDRLLQLVAESHAATADVIRHRPALYAMLRRFDDARETA